MSDRPSWFTIKERPTGHGSDFTVHQGAPAGIYGTIMGNDDKAKAVKDLLADIEAVATGKGKGDYQPTFPEWEAIVDKAKEARKHFPKP